MSRHALSLLIAASLAAVPYTAAGQVEPGELHGLTPRNIGPAGMSGRVAAVDVVPGSPATLWIGAATGGVWRSGDGGMTFEPVFDAEDASSIGAVAVFRPNPDIVWVGTGEANPRNSMGVGRGVWKSVDGGESWTFLGLGESERISRVVLHPSNPDIAWVAALGPAWSGGEQRGVFRTTDGGETWERLLYVNDSTGAADLVIDPSNPDKLFAAMWEYRRWPWFFRSGGPGSGIWVTHDGGETWSRLGREQGLPGGELGRSGLAIAPGDPDVVYALVEAERSALLRSDDGGRSFEVVNREAGVNPRPFYYADIHVDPANENRLYRIAGSHSVSEDGGRSFRVVVPSQKIHGDVHALWISADGMTMVQGSDGGIGITHDRGDTWRFVTNLPLAQYYHIDVDDGLPYEVYGGLQDNGSWVGPSEVWEQRGLRSYHFQRVGGGDGFAVKPDPTDSRFVYAMSQEGNLFRYDRLAGVRQSIQPVHPDGVPLRFNWNAGIALDPHDPETVYFGSQFLHRTADRGATWELLSPDLTTNDPEKQRKDTGGLSLDATGAENHTTIVTIAPSPVERGVLWVGTDDGNVQLTRDGGASWTNVVDEIPDVPDATWVPHIEASKHRPGTAYVVFDDHRRGNWETYVYRTEDYGESWDRLAAEPGAVDGFAHVIEEDPAEENLLFLGTEFGLWLSLDRGESWRKWTHGLPTVPVRALVVQEREADLVIGTHGRAAWVIDDVRPLRALARDPAIADRSLHLFPVPDAWQHENRAYFGYRATGDTQFFGDDPPYGAMVSVWVGEEPRAGSESGDAGRESERGRDAGGATDAAEDVGSASTATVDVLDADGAVVRTFERALEPGLDRFAWDLRGEGFRSPGEEPDEVGPGPEVPPGDYTIRVTLDGEAVEAPVLVRLDPRAEVTAADRRAKYRAALSLGETLETAADAVDRVRELEAALDLVLERLEDRDGADALRDEAAALQRERADLEATFLGPQDVQGIADRSGAVMSELRSAYFTLAGSLAGPTPTQMLRAERAEAVLTAGLAELNAFLTGPVADLRGRLTDAGIELMPALETVGR